MLALALARVLELARVPAARADRASEARLARVQAQVKTTEPIRKAVRQ
jgi:hypothetical protein